MSSRTTSTFIRLAALALAALPFLGAPATQAESISIDLRGHDNVVFDLGQHPDEAVVADAVSLAENLSGLAGRSADGKPEIVIRHLGKGRLLDGEANADGEYEGIGGHRDPTAGLPDDTSTESMMVAFNGRSRNEFLISTTTDHLASLHAEAERSGLNLESDGPPATRNPGRGRPTAGDPTLSLLGEASPFSFSNNNDDRFRRYGVNAPATLTVDRRRVQLGGGCTGTLVGPRHVVTAGHCLWNRPNQAWSNNFWVRAGASGTSSAAQVLVNSGNIPGGEVLWYFTPWGWRDPNNSATDPFDIGILVLPGRIGDTTGWYGWWVLNSTTLQANTINRARYPLCAATWGGQPRVDVPLVGTPPSCNPNHLYVNSNPCQVGNFQNVKDGWSRTFDHSCDAGAGDSGSGLYLNYNDLGNGVTGIHFFSLCVKNNLDIACTGNLVTRPLRAVRITPEYSGWIAHFRSKYP